MGIFKAAAGSLGGVMADQWLEMYYCDSMPQDVLARRGQKRVSENSANTKGSENVISDGSLIVVNEGQCAIVVELGKIIGIYDTPGENTFHSKRSGSIFSGAGIKGIGKQTAERFGFGGDVAIHQFVMYLDTKEHFGNPFSLAVPLSVTDKNTGFEYYATVNMGGVFSFRITNPETFYKNICGNSIGTVYKTLVQPQLATEFNSAATVALDKICGAGVEPTDIAKSVGDICAAIQEAMTEKWVSLRGFTVTSVAIDTIGIQRDDLKAFQTIQRAKMLTDPAMAAATLTAAQADAMQAAAVNPNGAGFVGMAAVMNTAAAPVQQAPKPTNLFLQKDTAKPTLWRCACGSMNTTNFCEKCGAKRPD